MAITIQSLTAEEVAARHLDGDHDLVLGPDDVLSGGSLLPGFAVPVRELFPHRPDR